MKQNSRLTPIGAIIIPLLVNLATTFRPDRAILHKETKGTKMSRRGFAFLLIAFLGTWIRIEAGAQIIVAPNALATNDGNRATTTPPGGPTSVREMQIFDASQFTNALSGPSFLTQFAWRPDMTPGASGPRSVNLRIYASTTARSVAGLSMTFADNLGTNNTLVFNGTLNWVTENLSGPGNTRQFDVVFPFTTPFLYDPARGNLLLDTQLSGNGSSITFDTVMGDPMVKKILNTTSSNATTALFETPAQVIQFTFETPPVVAIRASQVEVCWNSKSNLTYQVQYRSDLTTNLWTALGNCVQGSGSVNCFNDPIVLGQPQRFYRVLLTNCVP